MARSSSSNDLTRRELLVGVTRWAGLAGLAALGVRLSGRAPCGAFERRPGLCGECSAARFCALSPQPEPKRGRRE